MHLDDDTLGIDARGAVALGVAQLSVTHGRRIPVYAGFALEREPPGAVDLGEHADAGSLGVDRLLRTIAGDDAGDVRLGIEGETDSHHMR